MRQEAARSWLGGRNPTVKILTLFAISFAVLFLWDPLLLLILYLVAVVAIRWAARIRWPHLLLAQIPFVMFGLGVFMVNAVTRPGEQAFDAPIRITVEGLSAGTALALRALIIGIGAVAFIASTPPRDMMISAIQHGRLPPRFGYALLAGQRTLEQLPRTWATIRAAQAVRAPLNRRGEPKHGMRDFGRAAFALLVGAIRSSERIALALEARGLGDGPRTLWRPVPIGAADAMFVAVVLGSFAVIVAADLLLRG